MLLEECSWDNVWILRKILRGFELVFGLKVNFFKNKLYGQNNSDHFIQTTSMFLSCYMYYIPFNFLEA